MTPTRACFVSTSLLISSLTILFIRVSGVRESVRQAMSISQKHGAGVIPARFKTTELTQTLSSLPRARGLGLDRCGAFVGTRASPRPESFQESETFYERRDGRARGTRAAPGARVRARRRDDDCRRVDDRLGGIPRVGREHAARGRAGLAAGGVGARGLADDNGRALLRGTGGDDGGRGRARRVS